MAHSQLDAGPEAGPSDEELVSAFVRDGDRRAVETLIRRYSPRLRRLVMTLVGADAEMIMDAEQEVFTTLVQRLPRFRNESHFSTFFYRTARNRVLDLIRSNSRYRSRVAHLPDPDREHGSLDTPEQLLVDTERISTVRRAMSSLPPDDRLLLYLKDGEDVPVAALAELFRMPAGTVKSRLSRGREKLGRALKELGYEH